jgi:CNT family concentrative nucleoside transporter
MAAYVDMKISAAHLLTASVISAPAGLLIAKVLQPEVETPVTLGKDLPRMPVESSNLFEAAANGASDGLKLALNVGAMLIAFFTLLKMCDFALEHGWLWIAAKLNIVDPPQITLGIVLGKLFAPLAWLMGIAWSECQSAGELLGLKMVTTEFNAYTELSKWLQEPAAAQRLSPRSVSIVTYALCGFSNFASIGIQIGGIGALAPERRRDLTRLGFRAMLGGTLACFMTACVASVLI